MGGKTKQSQRTKNNVRPSSSSRSAEILNNSVNPEGGLVSVSGGKMLPALFPTLAAVNLDQGLNPEFQMCIKKLNKKDPITRAKAVQELCELVNNGNPEDVVAALPSWAHFYKTLTSDTDRKVREVTQICHHAIMRVCGRRAAPQLKALLPSWLQAQYDEHAPAQTNAQQSLKSTFPDSKLPEVISFCKAEVMAHLLENLIGNTEAIITKKIESPEERELQMCRIVTSSLRGLEYFTPNLPAQHHDWLWQELSPLLEAGAHWKFAQHSAHQVRAAWYGAMGRIIERYKGQFGEKYGLKTMRLMLNAAKDNNAQVAAQIWTCLLQFMHNIENWHTYLDKKELLIKRILDVLETGGWGDAKHLSTMLLPLMAHLPEEIKTKQFYESFFDAVYKGLDNKNVLISKSEQRAWVTSLAECLRYLSIQQNDFIVEIATSVHRVWLEKVLSQTHDPQIRNNLIKCSATNMTSLVKYWLKLSKEGHTEKYDQLLRNFWQNIGSTVLAQIDNCSTDLAEIEKLIDGHITLLQTLKTSFMQETKKQQSIKFHGDENSVEERSPVTTQEFDVSLVERYKHNLDDLVNKICAHYFEAAEKKQVSSTILTPLITLLIEFDSRDLFVAMARQFNVDSLYKFYDKVIRNWLAGDTMRCKAVVDILFLMMKYFTEEEQDAMFDSFKQFTPAVVEWCLSVCMSHPYIEQGASRRWAQSAAAAQAVAALANRAAVHSDVRATALLFMCLADSSNGEPLISDEGVSQVIRTVTKAIEDTNSPTLESSGALAARLVTTLASTEHPVKDANNFTALVLNLYKLNLAVPRGHRALSVHTWCEVQSSWQDGVAALPADMRRHFLHEAATLIHAELFKNIDTTLNIANLEHVVSLCPFLFHGSVGKQSSQPQDISEIITFTKQIFNINYEEDLIVETCALRHHFVTSQINCLYEDENMAAQNVIRDSSEQNVKEMTKSEILRYVNKHLFHAIYLKTLLKHKSDAVGLQNPYHQFGNARRPWLDTLLLNNYIQSEYCKSLYFFVVMDALFEGYTFWPHYEVIEKAKQRLDTIILEVIFTTNFPIRNEITNVLLELATEKGYYWAFAHRMYRYHAIPDAKEGPDFDLNNLGTDVSGNGFFHMLQAAAKWTEDKNFIYQSTYLILLRSWNVAFAREGESQFLNNSVNSQELQLDAVINAYYRNRATMLYETDISAAPWAQVVANVAVIQYLEQMVSHSGWVAPAHYWDFATISLCSLIASVRQSQHKWGCTKVSMVAWALVRLFFEIRSFIESIRDESIRREPLPHVFDLIKEWKDIFAPDTHDNLFNCFINVLGTDEISDLTVPKSQYLFSMIMIAPKVEWKNLNQSKSVELSLERLAKVAASALERPAHPTFKYLAYYMIVTMAKDLVFDDAQKLSLWSDDSVAETDEEKDRPIFSLDYFHDTFVNLQEIVEAAINHVVPGEAICDLVPFSDSHSMALGWLLLADAMAAICKLGRGDLTQFYIQVYREGKYGAPQLTASLRLLPAPLAAFATDSTGATLAPPQYIQHFLVIQPFCMRSACGGKDIGALACRGVLTAVCGAGCSAARGWWGAARPHVARALERLVTAYVAPHAVKEQLTHLQERAAEIPDTEIRIAWSSWEVVCDYSVEESTLQLRVQMMRAHPLKAPKLTAPDANGPGSNTQWLSLYLAYQNGTLLNALKMWTEAVNARVEKSPQCYICYCRLHPGTGKLPRVPCHQCRNKFHHLCLRKWFSTSNKSNCPLCRATF